MLSFRRDFTSSIPPIADQVTLGTSTATDLIADIDAWMAGDLSADKLAGKPFAHLPVLGVPGWWAANENPDFYADTSVFRPLRVLPLLG